MPPISKCLTQSLTRIATGALCSGWSISGSRDSAADAGCYDMGEGLWHERAGYNTTTKVNSTRYQPWYHAFVPEWGQGGKHIVGDPVTGKLYEQALKYYDDDGLPIQYLRAFPHLAERRPKPVPPSDRGLHGDGDRGGGSSGNDRRARLERRPRPYIQDSAAVAVFGRERRLHASASSGGASAVPAIASTASAFRARPRWR
mgnify:CR=1 FL=1